MQPKRPRAKLEGWTVVLLLAPLIAFGALLLPRYGTRLTFTSLDLEDGFDTAFGLGIKCFLFLLLLGVAGGLVHAIDTLPWHIRAKAGLLALGFVPLVLAALFLVGA